MAENNKNFEFRPDDFVLVQQHERITDKKLETKPTTFFKDAIRRFAKNKASLVAACILGILILLAIFVPIFSKSDIVQVKTPEAFLAPKLFEAGTGFWDGTRTWKHIVYDREKEVPALSEKYTPEAVKKSLVSITVDTAPSHIDSYNQYASGGFVVVSTDAAILDKNAVFTSKPTTFTAKDGYKLSIDFCSTDNVSASKLGEYRVYLSMKDETTQEESIVLLKDYSKDYSKTEINISEALEKAGMSTLKASVVIEVASAEDAYRYVLIDALTISADASAKNSEDLEAMSFDDATLFLGVEDTKSMEYWSCTGRKGIYNAEIYYCDCVVDTYYLVYGDADSVTYSATELYSWIENGWCTYDYKVGPESFVRLTNDCPIDVVDSQQILKVTKKLSSITGRGYNYRRYGYTEMPRYLFGTDASGFDIVKRAFAGLRTSLILGLCVAAFSLAFGVVWGSISGYFGGSVDLFMERFTEILGGVPWIVIMTLCILHFGNGFGVFILACCMVDWMGPAHLTRTQFYRFKGREYILASRTLGASDTRLIFKHILPNSIGTIITSTVLMVPSIIYSEASLAYLNLGLQGLPSFGVMMAANQSQLAKYPNLVIFPAVIMALLMISFNLFGNGLRDAFNPALKGTE